MTGEDGTFNLQKIAILRGSVRGAVLSGGLLAFLLLLPQAVTAAPGPAGGPGKGLTAGQAGSARQGARVQASREVEAGSNPDPLPDKAEPPSKAGTFELHGTFRYLYGQGRFDGRALSPRTGRQEAFQDKMIMPTFRTRLYLDYHMDDHWSAHTAVEDNRVLNDRGLDDRAHVFRAYVTGNYPVWRYYAGRIGKGRNRREGFLVSTYNIGKKKGFSFEG